MLPGRFSGEERAHQRRGLFGVGLIFDPHPAGIDRQLAPAAGQQLAPHHGGDAVRRKIPAHDVGFRRMPRDVHPFHAAGASARLTHSA